MGGGGGGGVNVGAGAVRRELIAQPHCRRLQVLPALVCVQHLVGEEEADQGARQRARGGAALGPPVQPPRLGPPPLMRSCPAPERQAAQAASAELPRARSSACLSSAARSAPPAPQHNTHSRNRHTWPWPSMRLGAEWYVQRRQEPSCKHLTVPCCPPRARPASQPGRSRAPASGPSTGSPAGYTCLSQNTGRKR